MTTVAKYFSVFVLVGTVFSMFVVSAKLISEPETYKTDFRPTDAEIKACKANISNCCNFSSYPQVRCIFVDVEYRDLIDQLIFNGTIKREWSNDMNSSKVGCLSNDFDGWKNLCKFTHEVRYPQAGFDVENKFRYIVQSKKHSYRQGVTTVTCTGVGNDRDFAIENEQGNMAKSSIKDFTCNELSYGHFFVALDEEGKLMPHVALTFPTCCMPVCKHC